MAIVLDVYACSHKLLRQALDASRVEDTTGDEVRHNPMAIFLWTYFNELRGKLLVREDTFFDAHSSSQAAAHVLQVRSALLPAASTTAQESDENLSSEEMSIRLELLPGSAIRPCILVQWWELKKFTLGPRLEAHP
eukprot:311331-Amphidinium_carterae.1